MKKNLLLVLVVPAVITMFPRVFGAPSVERLGSAA